MCGIVGYVGQRPGQPIILDGLKRLEYRGYDSAGIALVEDDAIGTLRAVGNLDALFAAAAGTESDACVGLGHTRWATHGRPSEENAHPHDDCSGRISIVLNGIIENYKDLRDELVAGGHVFKSETDAEVVAHLLEERIDSGLREAVRLTVPRLRGHFAFCAIALNEPDLIVGTRHEAPLVVGVGDGEMFLASAIPAFLAHTKRMTVLEEGDIVCITADGATFCDIDGKTLARTVEDVPWDDDAAEKGGFETFMLKEIYEQPRAIADTLLGRLREDGSVDLGEVGLGDDLLRRLRRIYIVACGTSYHAGLIASYALEQLARVPVQIEVASEYRYKDPVLDPDTLVIGITQSGETLDTLMAMRSSRAAGAPVMALTNIMGSQATRDADAVLYTRAGLEIGVAATKTHIAQVAALLLFALHLARVRGATDTPELLRIGRELGGAPDLVQAYLDDHGGLDEIAARYHDQRFFLYLGRHVGYGVCLEGALKLKEISYIPTEAYAAGEMKHGPIALLDEGSPVVVVATDGPVFEKVVSNIEEVRARKADVIAVASAGNTSIDGLAAAVLRVPRCDPWVSPLVAVVPLQLLAYGIARLTGCNVDQPRNLAKTVTVE
jgi:glutamine---fructose-6-phosphate transaminase (isomerizing)